MRYDAGLTAGALKIPESRILSSLLLQGLDREQWKHALEVENVLQTRSPRTAQRLGTLLRRRLETMQPPLWEMVRDGSLPLATQACLAAAIKSSPLLGDFLDLVVREQRRLFQPTLQRNLWEPYVESCRSRDPELPRWSDATIERLGQSVFQILAQADILESTRTLRLQRLHLAREVESYLRSHDERYVLRCLEAAA